MINKKNINNTEDINYGYYSKLLKQPFDSIAELRNAEAKYYAEQKAKEDKAATKKADAKKVEDAFKAMNAARKEYKENLTQLTTEYADALADIKKAFEAGKADIHSKLAAAEEAYAKALKEFTGKYETYHLSLKDGDFETTVRSQTTNTSGQKDDSIMDIFNLFFGI